MKVLIIEDSERLPRSLGRGLTKAGYAVDLAADGRTGLAYAETYEYEAIVLDLMLPGLPGLEVLRRLREAERDTHVLILSAKDRVEDRVKGLKMGADDYLVKPFSFDELCARLQALVRRQYRAKSPRLKIAPLEIDVSSRQVFRDGESVPLTSGEYALLEFLAYRRGRVASQDQILEHLHRSDSEVSSNVIEVLDKGRGFGNLSLGYVGDYLLELGSDRSQDVYLSSQHRLDLAAGYSATDWAQIYLHLNNLTDEPARMHQGSPDRLFRVEYTGWSTRLGLKLRF